MIKQNNDNIPQKKSFSQVFYFMQGCQLDKLQACVPRLLKDKALPVVWLCGLIFE